MNYEIVESQPENAERADYVITNDGTYITVATGYQDNFAWTYRRELRPCTVMAASQGFGSNLHLLGMVLGEGQHHIITHD